MKYLTLSTILPTKNIISLLMRRLIQSFNTIGNNFLQARKICYLIRQTKSKSKSSLMSQYQGIKEKQTRKSSSSSLNIDTLKKTKKHHCNGCNALLQSQDKASFGFIDEKVFENSIKSNTQIISSTYRNKIMNDDPKVLGMIAEVQRELGVKILNQKTKQLDHLEEVDVFLRLQEKIDSYEKQEQILHRSINKRQQLFCYRCYCLKHHNKLPTQYDTSADLQQNRTQTLMKKIIKKHKNSNTHYLYLVDVLDIAGSFQRQIFMKLINEGMAFSIVINKIDIVNENYIDKSSLLRQVKAKMYKFVQKVGMSSNDQIINQLKNTNIFMISNINKQGIEKLKKFITKCEIKRVQMLGFPNAGKTSLLNQLSKLNKPTSKVPGTTTFITEHHASKILYYDMPGFHNEHNLYNLISKPNLKSLLTWNKHYSPPIMNNSAFFFGGKVEIQGCRIIPFGLGGACSSDNRWFMLNYQQFWKGLPSLSDLKIVRHQVSLSFIDGVSQDLEIFGWGFIAFRLSIPSSSKKIKNLILYLPQKIQYCLRQTVVKDTKIIHSKTVQVKRSNLSRVQRDKQEERKKLNLLI